MGSRKWLVANHDHASPITRHLPPNAGLISEWNENMCMLSGYSKQEMVGIRLADCNFIDAQNRASIAEVISADS